MDLFLYFNNLKSPNLKKEKGNLPDYDDDDGDGGGGYQEKQKKQSDYDDLNPEIPKPYYRNPLL